MDFLGHDFTPITEWGIPSRVSSPVRVTQASCGWRHTAVLDYHRRVWSWGAIDFGRLGLGDEAVLCEMREAEYGERAVCVPQPITKLLMLTVSAEPNLAPEPQHQSHLPEQRQTTISDYGCNGEKGLFEL